MGLSPKGQLLAVGTVDDAIPVLDVASGKVAHTLAGHDGGTNGLAFLSGNSLASVGEDGSARVWNVARAACLHQLPVDADGADRWAGGCGAPACGCAACRLSGGQPGAGLPCLASAASRGQARRGVAAAGWGCGQGSAVVHHLHLTPHWSPAAVRCRTGSGHSVGHLTGAPGAKSFACSAGRLVTIFTLGASPQQQPSRRVLGPLDSTVGGAGREQGERRHAAGSLGRMLCLGRTFAYVHGQGCARPACHTACQARTWLTAARSQVESLRFDRRGNLLATYNGGVSYWNFERREEDKQELGLPHSGACLCGDVTPGAPRAAPPAPAAAGVLPAWGAWAGRPGQARWAAVLLL